MITFNYLMAQAIIVLNAKLKKENTANRIGALFRDLLFFIQNMLLGIILKGEKVDETEIKSIVDPKRGDTYKAVDTGSYWCYDGAGWNNIGELIPSNALTDLDITQSLTDQTDTVPSNKAVKERALSIGVYDDIEPIVTDKEDKIILGWDIPNKKLFILNLLKTLEGTIGLDSLDNELSEKINTILEKTDRIQLIQTDDWYLGALDSEDKVFWGINRDKEMYLFGEKVKNDIIGFSYISNDEWIVAISDTDNKIIWGIDRSLKTYPDGYTLQNLTKRVEQLEDSVTEIKETLDPDNIGSFNILDINFVGSFSTLQELEKTHPITDVVHLYEGELWKPSLLTHDTLVGNSDVRCWYASVGGYFAYVRWDGKQYTWFLSNTVIDSKPTIGMRVAIYRELSTGVDFEDVIKQTYLTNNVLTSNNVTRIKNIEPDVLLIPNAGYTQYKTGVTISDYLKSLDTLLSSITNTQTTVLVYSAPNMDANYKAWISQIKDKCENYSIQFIDLFSTSGINAININTYALDDKTLNQIGAKRISSSFEYNPCRHTDTNKKGIPVIYIDTVDGLFFDDRPKSTKMQMTRFEVDVRNSGLNGFDGTLVPDKDEIRGRGNSTWSMPKKPYRLKFDKKVSFFGLPAEKNWVMLATYEDKSSIRPAMAHKLGNSINEYRLSNNEQMWYCPTAQMVELVLNDRYEGLYCFTDHVGKVTSSRVNIPEPAPEDIAILNTTLGHYELKTEIYPNVSGGFLLELEADDRALEEMGVPKVNSNNIVTGSTGDVFIHASYGDTMRYFACKTLEFYKKDFVTPTSPNGIVLQSYMNYITDFINDVNSAIISPKEVVDGKTYLERVSECIDLNTFIDYFFIQEIAKNSDAQGFSSIYYFKDRDKEIDGKIVKEKLKAGPLWDFGASFGSFPGYYVESPEGWWIRDNSWIYELTRDTQVKQLFIDRWNAIDFGSKWSAIMDKLVTQSYAPAYRNSERWSIGKETYLKYPIPYIPTSSDYYEQEVVWLRKWIQTRIEWINNNINSI